MVIPQDAVRRRRRALTLTLARKARPSLGPREHSRHLHASGVGAPGARDDDDAALRGKRARGERG